MIALLLAAALGAPPSAPPDVPPLRNSPSAIRRSAAVLAKYAEAVEVYRTPAVLSFEYTVDQTGARDIQQLHRVFRSGNSLRDELLVDDGKRLDPPTVTIVDGRRSRYTVEALAPRADAYTFTYLRAVRDGHHTDYVFAATALDPGLSVVRDLTIDGVTYLPVSIHFTTTARKGRGTITFGRVDKYWMVQTASATATYAKLAADERITFSRYRFPLALPPSTFERPRPLPTFRPTPS